MKFSKNPINIESWHFSNISISRQKIRYILHFLHFCLFRNWIYILFFHLLVGVADKDPGRSERKKSEVGADIVIRDVGKPTVRVELFICRDEGDREEETSPPACTGDKIYGVVRPSLRQAATSFTPIQLPRSLFNAAFRFMSSLTSPPRRSLSPLLFLSLWTDIQKEKEHDNTDHAATWNMCKLFPD